MEKLGTNSRSATFVGLVAIGLLLLAPAAVRAEGGAARSGTIIDGEWATGPVGGCTVMPDCAAWQASGCKPALARRNPALYSSIVPVERLADGATAHSFTVQGGRPAGVNAGGILIEFWDASCHEVGVRPSWWDVPCRFNAGCRANVVVPRGARWMTVTSNGNANVRWNLW